MSTVAMEPKTGYELSITRTFDAPRELVWKAWTNPEMATQWLGPRGFRGTEFTSSLEPGGQWHATTVGKRPGTETEVSIARGGRYLEIRPPELLKFTFAWDVRASVGLPESPFKENVITVRLEEQGGKTVMHFTQAPFATESERDGHKGGWNSAFDSFAEFMLREQPDRKPEEDEAPTELHLRRFFAAPRQMVFDAWTKPEMVKQWWGPRGFSTEVEKLEAHQGGEIRFRMQGHGFDHTMTGRFVDFYPPHRFVFTAGVPDPKGDILFENWNSVLFEEVEGGTEVVLDVHVLKSVPGAAVYIKGMREGWSQSLDRLAEFVLG